MAVGSFVLSAYTPKPDEERRRIRYRSTTRVRYLVVVLAIVIVFAYEYCFDNPSALQQQIEHNYDMDHEEPMGEAQFNLLYAVYSFPNVVIPILGGILIDKIGARVVLILTAGLCVIGQLVFSYGGFFNSFAIMLVSRVIFGLGGQVLQGSQNTIISNWFTAGQLSLVLGICVSFPKMGSSVNNYLSPFISKEFTDDYEMLGMPLVISFFFMTFALLLAFILGYLDRRTEKKERIQHESALLSSQSDPRDRSQLTSEIRSQKKISVRIEESSFVKGSVAHVEPTIQTGEHLSMAALKKLPAAYWILILISTLAESLFIPFLDNGNKYYMQVFKGVDEPEQAGFYLVVPYVVGALLVPPIGILVEKIPFRSITIIATCFSFFLTYAFIFFMETSSSMREEQWIRFVPVTLLGISIALFCTAIIPTIPMLVNPRHLGTAFGLMEVLQNLALGVLPLIIGQLRETKETDLQGFHLQTQFLFLLSCLCLGAGILLKGIDLVTGHKLDLPDFRKQYVSKIIKEED